MKRVFAWLFFLALGGGLTAALFFFYIARSLPSSQLITAQRIPQSTKIYDRTGAVLLYEIHGEEKRTTIPFDSIPLFLKQATIALEDANFYTHAAFEPKSLLRAFWFDLRNRGALQGGSTITQQLAKNAFLSPERTLTRKVKELLLAFQLERRFTKDEILNLYLNYIPYGANTYGVEAASQAFFGKSAKDLLLPEAATLAAVAKAPTRYSPWGGHLDELLARKNLTLERMFKEGFITEKVRDEAREYALNFVPQLTGIKAPHFVIAIQDYLANAYGEDFVRTAGLKVTTTLDWDLQQIAEKAVADGAARNEELYRGKNAALVAEDPTTGQVLALVGSRDYFDVENEGNFNVATQGLRQPGSSIKPFAYAAAFERGYPSNTIIFDTETEFDTTGDPERSYHPHNYDNTFRGPITMRESLAQSINVSSVKTLYLAGIDQTLAILKKFGITTLNDRNRYGLSLVLGGGEVKLAELVNAYSVFAQDGIFRKQTMVLEVKDGETVLEKYRDNSTLAIEPQYARMINDILSDPEARRPLFQNSFAQTVFSGYEVALKTGTTNDYRDAWALGYTPKLVVGVWAGNNDNQPMQKKGGSILAAVPIWHQFLAAALLKTDAAAFQKPDLVSVAKPMLNGSSIAVYSDGIKQYPQIHSILYYARIKDPLGPLPINPAEDSQFTRWEEGVLVWASRNIPGFSTSTPSVYNQPIPGAASLMESQFITPQKKDFISLTKPTAGFFINSTPFEISLELSDPLAIDRIEILFNGFLVTIKNSFSSTDSHYQFFINPLSLLPQNTITVNTYAKNGGRFTREVIVYHQTNPL